MKIRMIYLAAGNSRRFGSNKLYYEIQGRPMFQYGLDTLEKVMERNPDTSLTVVTEYPLIREYVQKKKSVWQNRLETVRSPEHEKGISYSIKAGLTGDKADYYLFCVADQPGLSPDTLLQLIQRTTEESYAGGYICWKGNSGNPAIFSAELLPELMALTGDTGGKKILMNRENVCTVEAGSPEETEDIDRKPF